jgi:hypothetical protein
MHSILISFISRHCMHHKADSSPRRKSPKWSQPKRWVKFFLKTCSAQSFNRSINCSLKDCKFLHDNQKKRKKERKKKTYHPICLCTLYANFLIKILTIKRKTKKKSSCKTIWWSNAVSVSTLYIFLSVYLKKKEHFSFLFQTTNERYAVADKVHQFNIFFFDLVVTVAQIQ